MDNGIVYMLLGALCFGIFSFLKYRLFDKLLRIVVYDHSEQWCEEGSPSGFFWKPEGCIPNKSDLARWKLVGLWSVKAPKWAAGNAHAVKLSRFYMWAARAEAVCFVVVIYGLVKVFIV